MKVFLIISVLTFVFCTNLLSQIEFAPVGATWYYDRVEGTSPPHEGYVKIESLKDTIMDGNSAKKMLLSYVSSIGDVVKRDTDILYQSVDSIFYYRDNAFQLMYVFNMKIGDSLRFFGDGFNPCSDNIYGHVRVDSLFTTTIGSEQLKGMNLSELDSSKWSYSQIVERIGLFFGFYPMYVNECQVMDAIPPIGKLRCYEDPNYGQFKYQDIPCDTLIRYNTITSLREFTNIEIYPTITNYTINISSKEFLVSNIVIINSIGKIVFEENYEFFTKELNISHLDKGVYFIIVQSSDKIVYRQKILKL